MILAIPAAYKLLRLTSGYQYFLLLIITGLKCHSVHLMQSMPSRDGLDFSHHGRSKPRLLQAYFA